ncbi:MAG: trigger factor, partial [Oscillospiraceae bacterium]|nr:trigger factor [Oscillospiraceae bacterium]
SVDNQLIDKLVGLVRAEIPEAMYENRIDEDMRDFAYRLQSQGMNMETYMKYTGLDRDGVRKQFRPQAERQVKLRLALEKIAELEAVKVPDEDIEKEYKKIADGYKTDVEKVKKVIAREDLEKDLAVEKAFNLVKDKAVIAEGEPPKEEPAKAGSEPKNTEKKDSKTAE